MWRTPIGRVRAVGILEGISFLMLLGIAMPLKYLAGMPLAVRIAGLAHGVLFLALLYVVMQAAAAVEWSWRRCARVIFAALLPCGPFVIDRSLAREDAGRPTNP